MAVKKCCIRNCKSCSTRKEDRGVTYHKFPKNTIIRDIWINVTHYNHTDIDIPKYVCSRHFCKHDFQSYKDSKYILKSDAVPSIFPWDSDSEEEEVEALTMEGMSTDDIENVDAIKRYIEAQEKEILEQQLADAKQLVDQRNVQTSETTHNGTERNGKGTESKSQSDNGTEVKSQSDNGTEVKSQSDNGTEIKCQSDNGTESKEQSKEETLSVASSVMDMIINESELEIARKNDEKLKPTFSAADKGNNSSMALSIGSKVEAKDFSDDWHPAQIIEVDYDEMEVLVHYGTEAKKHDEWISVSSPRLRPATTSSSVPVTTVKPGPSSEESITDSIPIATLKEEIKEKSDEKTRPTYTVGERCLARWRDNRRFIATISKDLGDGKYEIIFDDGCIWTCTTTRIHKLRSKTDDIADVTSASGPGSFGAGPSNAGPTNLPAFHTHLFDPTRDYLGSKSERREMKRKLNIKEIFNIGQKKCKKINRDKPSVPVEKKPRVMKKKRKPLKVKLESEIKKEVVEPKMELPDAVASIIGTLKEEPTVAKEEIPNDKPDIIKVDLENEMDMDDDVTETTDKEDKPTESKNEDLIQLEDLKNDHDPVLDEEVKLEQFEKPDNGTHEEVIDRIKEAINKLEGGLKTEKTEVVSPKVEPTPETIEVKEQLICPEVIPPESDAIDKENKAAELIKLVKENVKSKKLSKVKKGKKLRLLQEKKVKKQVAKVKSELEEMKKQVDEMRKAMLKTQDLAKTQATIEMPESFLLPGEWCCKWVNGQPVGTVSEVESEMKPDHSGKPPLPRRSVQVEDKRLPEGWTKHMVRRSFGNSAGKWDVVLVNPENRRFHTKNEIRNYLELNPQLKDFENVLTDFGVHLKLARRMGWISHTADGAVDGPASPLPVGTLSSTSPLIKRKKLSLKRDRAKDKVKRKVKRPKLTLKVRLPRLEMQQVGPLVGNVATPGMPGTLNTPTTDPNVTTPALEDGYVYVGSLKVQIIDNLLRCPAEGCFKNFRNNTLLQMHIKHYHKELITSMGATPKVLDLAYARTMPLETETPPRKEPDHKVIKVKLPRPQKREEPKPEVKDINTELFVDTVPLTPVKDIEVMAPTPKTQDSPKLRQALIHKPVKRPRVLLPVRRLEPEQPAPETNPFTDDPVFEENIPMQPIVPIPAMNPQLDFESAISTHTVTKPVIEKKKKVEKKRKFAAAAKKPTSEEDEWYAGNSDMDTRFSFPRSGSPDPKVDTEPTPEPPKENKEPPNYMYTETGERIKIVRMKREEIINCHCGFREEDGLMVQCELCLCWQHAMCHNIDKESDVPEKYTCSICLNPRRGRRSKRFLHDQDRMYEGLLPGAKPCESLRRSHELAGNLLRIEDALHALRVKYYVATKKDHPKLYLWATDWEQAEIQYTQEKLNSDYSDLNIMINTMDKENRPECKDIPLDIRTPPSEEQDTDRFLQRDAQLGSQALLSSLLSSPGGASLDLPISTSELERLAKSVQAEQEIQQRMAVTAPQPEAAIENSACRKRLLKHIQRCQALIDARLDSIEAQVAELESQDPSFEDDDTGDFFPRTKQTVEMLMRDLDTMEELGVIT